jgi:hypothetical protein
LTNKRDGEFEARLHAMLVGRASSVSASADDNQVAALAARARKRHRRRQWATGVSAGTALIAAIAFITTSGGGDVHQAGRGPVDLQHEAHRTVLLLPLSGTVTASGPRANVRAGEGVSNAAASNASSAPPVAASGATSGPIDVAPPSSASLQRLFSHDSPDGVQVTVFSEPRAESRTTSTPTQQGLAPGGPPAVFPGCLSSTPLTVEVSDTAAVGTFSEPLFLGAAGALVDVQIGEIGSTEGEQATWVLAQTGSGAVSVQVQFADGSTDMASVPTSGVVVLGHKGAPTSTLGSGTVATITVLGSGGQTLTSYGLGVSTHSTRTGNPPTSLPPPGPTQPTDPTAATAAVTKAVETALGCSSSPLQRSQDIANGDALEAVPDFSGASFIRVDGVVFASATSAVAEYNLYTQGSGTDTGPLYAAVNLIDGIWEVSLSSVSPNLQVTPPNQVGNVTVAPGGPLFVQDWPGGTAVGVYKALPGSQGASGYGTGVAACLPAGGTVEEITTPGAVKVLTAPLFPNYASSLIGATVSTVGAAEGAPATVVAVETGSQVTTVAVFTNSGTVTETPTDGVAVIVLPGDPSSVLGATGSQLTVSDASGNVLDTVSLQVDATQPAGPSSLPSSLPVAGQGPTDSQAAIHAIDQAFTTVFDCDTPPIERIENIQDGSLVAGALEELDTGPYEALASSSYVTVNSVVFQSPTLADIGFTLLFHSDATLQFAMIGQAVVVSGSWRVSYSTVCAAVQLGLGNCQT